MWLLGDLDSTFPGRSFGSIEHKQRKKRLGEEFRKTEEYQPEFWVFTLAAAFRVEEPNTMTRIRPRLGTIRFCSSVVEVQIGSPRVNTDSIATLA